MDLRFRRGSSDRGLSTSLVRGPRLLVPVSSPPTPGMRRVDAQIRFTGIAESFGSGLKALVTCSGTLRMSSSWSPSSTSRLSWVGAVECHRPLGASLGLCNQCCERLNRSHQDLKKSIVKHDKPASQFPVTLARPYAADCLVTLRGTPSRQWSRPMGRLLTEAGGASGLPFGGSHPGALCQVGMTLCTVTSKPFGTTASSTRRLGLVSRSESFAESGAPPLARMTRCASGPRSTWPEGR